MKVVVSVFHDQDGYYAISLAYAGDSQWYEVEKCGPFETEAEATGVAHSLPLSSSH